MQHCGGEAIREDDIAAGRKEDERTRKRDRDRNRNGERAKARSRDRNKEEPEEEQKLFCSSVRVCNSEKCDSVISRIRGGACNRANTPETPHVAKKRKGEKEKRTESSTSSR